MKKKDGDEEGAVDQRSINLHFVILIIINIIICPGDISKLEILMMWHWK